MELNEKQKKTQEILAKVLAEAWENESFKKELIAHPEAAIEKLTGERLNLKEGSKMVVVDQTASNTFYFNMPAKPNFEDMQLTEEQLEMVAGGGWKLAVAGAIVGFMVMGPYGAVAGAVAGATY